MFEFLWIFVGWRKQSALPKTPSEGDLQKQAIQENLEQAKLQKENFEKARLENEVGDRNAGDRNRGLYPGTKVQAAYYKRVANALIIDEKLNVLQLSKKQRLQKDQNN